MANFLLAKYRNELKAFRKYFHDTKKRQTVHNIHKLRVSIKKLKALHNVLLPFIRKSESVRYLHLFDDLFRSAGRVREAQVNIKLISAANRRYLSSYLDWEKKINKSARKNFKGKLNQFDLKELDQLEQVVGCALSNSSDENQLQNATNFLTKSLNRIEGLMRSPRNDGALHTIRKHVRRCNETLKLIDGSEVNIKVKKLLSGMTQIQDRTGSWHDRVVLIESLNRFLQNQTSRPIKQYVQKQQLIANKIRDEIYDALQSDLPVLIKKSNLKI